MTISWTLGCRLWVELSDNFLQTLEEIIEKGIDRFYIEVQEKDHDPTPCQCSHLRGHCHIYCDNTSIKICVVSRDEFDYYYYNQTPSEEKNETEQFIATEEDFPRQRMSVTGVKIKKCALVVLLLQSHP